MKGDGRDVTNTVCEPKEPFVIKDITGAVGGICLRSAD